MADSASGNPVNPEQSAPPPPPALTAEELLARLQSELINLSARQAEAEKSYNNACHHISEQLAHLSQQQTRPPRTRVKAATPSDYDGDRSKGRSFINSCNVYFRLCADHFADDQARILWALSYMKHGRAAKWADGIFRWEEANDGEARFVDWADFAEEFRMQFFPVDSESGAVNVLV